MQKKLTTIFCALIFSSMGLANESKVNSDNRRGTSAVDENQLKELKNVRGVHPDKKIPAEQEKQEDLETQKEWPGASEGRSKPIWRPNSTKD